MISQHAPCFLVRSVDKEVAERLIFNRLVIARDGALLSGGERLAPTEPAGETSNRLSTGHGAQTKK